MPVSTYTSPRNVFPTATYTYQGVPATFPANSGCFLCSEPATTPGTGQRNGLLLSYGDGRDSGLIDDISFPMFLGRANAAMEVGQASFNVASLPYKFPPTARAMDGTTMPEDAIRAIVADQHNGYICRFQDAKGRAWLGGLALTQTSFSYPHGQGGWTTFSAMFYQIG